jgi:catechol 2,3-dioxygenase-like lactoylglutathione lyase family enzyme
MGVQLTKEGFDLGIVTTNGDAMLEFYRDVLGFEYETTLNMEKVGVAAMHRVWADKSLLKIVVPVKDVPAGATGGMMGGTGLRYFTISVSNLDEILADCEAAGATIVWTKREVRPGVVVGMVEDPDGNWVEFIQNS